MALESASAHPLAGAASFIVGPSPLPGLLTLGRQLGGANALLDLVQRILDRVEGGVAEAQGLFEELSRPGSSRKAWAEALLRYQRTAQTIRGWLAAVQGIGLSLSDEGLEEELGLAASLDLLSRILPLLPPVPADAEAAADGLEPLAAMAAAVMAARASFSAGQRLLEARFILGLGAWPEQAGLPAALADTDLEKEAVRLQALQVRQQLAGHAIGLAAVMPRCLLELDGD
ncbi:MAG TPA: hypothetical protein VNZ61_25285 [Roseomonas sp.]|nr:hypothetical protein [Roseomonas sp.]